MSKQITFDPKELRKSQVVKGVDIPVNQYKSDFKKELAKYGKERLIRVYYDMKIIREFETMLDTIKKTGEYYGVKFNHRGPAHLSAGQESACVGQAMALEPEDLIFGSHRSHGEILAKCFSAIYKMKDDDLVKIM
ncbi:MAG: thiamine pyrophosphate-dependent enzyme, partial [Sphaerochaetaceae bacterium]